MCKCTLSPEQPLPLPAAPHIPQDRCARPPLFRVRVVWENALEPRACLGTHAGTGGHIKPVPFRASQRGFHSDTEKAARSWLRRLQG